MRLCLVLLLTVCLHGVSVGQAPTFHERILERITHGPTFLIVVELESTQYKGPALINNGDLFVFLHRREGLNQKDYRAFMKRLFKQKATLYVKEVDLEKTGFIKVSENPLFKNASKAQIFDKYFECRLFDSDLLVSLRNTDAMYEIAYALFKLQVPTYMDDPSGLLALADVKPKDCD